MNIVNALSLSNAIQLSGFNTTAASAAGKAVLQALANDVAEQDTMVRKHHQPLGQRLSDTPSADELAQAVRGGGFQVDIYKPLSDEEEVASLSPEFIHPSKLTEAPASLSQTMLEIRSLLR